MLCCALRPWLAVHGWFCAVLLFAAASPGFGQPGPSTAAARPNILFVLADDASYPHFGAYGTKWVRTPVFDRIAVEGILFENAYTPNAKCAPSRAAALTGRNPWQLKAAGNHWPFYPDEFKTYVEALGDHGYFVGSTGKPWAPGIARVDGKRRELTGRRFNRRTLVPPTSEISTVDYAANLLEFLDTAPAGHPFCFWVGVNEPHRAYERGSGVRIGGKRLSDIEEVPEYWPDNETVRTEMLDYALEIEHFDRQLGRMLEIIETRGLRENTLVVVTSDNGMPFPRSKGMAYEISVHVPLAVMWPGGIRNPGRRVTDFVSFIDFAPTFLEVAGVAEAESGMQPITGRSLTDIFASERAGRVSVERDHVLVGRERNDVGRPHDQGYPIRGIVTDEWLYLHNFEPDRWPAGNPETGYLDTDESPTKTWILNARRSGADVRYWNRSFGKRPLEELYKRRNDPANVHNLAAAPHLAERKGALRAQLFAQLRAEEDPRQFGQGHVFDEYPFSEDKLRGFYERYRRGEPVKAGWVAETDFEEGEL